MVRRFLAAGLVLAAVFASAADAQAFGRCKNKAGAGSCAVQTQQTVTVVAQPRQGFFKRLGNRQTVQAVQGAGCDCVGCGGASAVQTMPAAPACATCPK